MRTWKEYKETYSGGNDLFSWARNNDYNALYEHKDEIENFDMKNSSGYTALMLSIYRSNPQFAEILLDLGADVNSTDNLGNTPLMGASFKGDLVSIKLLLNYGADYKLQNKSGITAYNWAKAFGRENVLSFYNDKFSDVNVRNVGRLYIYLKILKLMLIKLLKK